MAGFISAPIGGTPRLNVVWTMQDAADALAEGVCDCEPVFSSTCATADERAKNVRKHMQRKHEEDLIEYLNHRTLNANNRYDLFTFYS